MMSQGEGEKRPHELPQEEGNENPTVPRSVDPVELVETSPDDRNITLPGHAESRATTRPFEVDPDNPVGPKEKHEPVVPPDPEAERMVQEMDRKRIGDLASLPSGPEKLEASFEALSSSPNILEQVDDLGLDEDEMASIAIRLAENYPKIFVDLLDVTDVGLTDNERLGVSRTIAKQSYGHFPDVARALALDEDEVKSIIRSSDPEVRQHIIQSFGTAGDFQKYERSEADDLTESSREFLNRAEEAEWSMSMALSTEYPERAVTERRRDRIAEELMRPITELAPISVDSCNAPMLAMMEGRETPAVFKPQRRESGFGHANELNPRLRNGIEPGTYYKREWLAYQVDRALGLDLVPVTVVRSGPEGIGSMQEWKPGESGSAENFMVLAARNDIVRECLEDMAFMDVATNNTDRHDGNWMIQPNDELEAIDNGLIFADSESESVSDGTRSWPLWAVGDQPLPERNRLRVERLRQSEAMSEALRECFRAALGDKAETAWEEFHDAIDWMMKEGLPAESDWDQDTKDAITKLQFIDSFKRRMGLPNFIVPPDGPAAGWWDVLQDEERNRTADDFQDAPKH